MARAARDGPDPWIVLDASLDAEERALAGPEARWTRSDDDDDDDDGARALERNASRDDDDVAPRRPASSAPAPAARLRPPPSLSSRALARASLRARFDGHADYLRDRARNDAYDAAIRRMCVDSRLTIDIGAGSGLLGLMARRAGAKDVVAFEVVPALAALARANARKKANGGRGEEEEEEEEEDEEEEDDDDGKKKSNFVVLDVDSRAATTVGDDGQRWAVVHVDEQEKSTSSRTGHVALEYPRADCVVSELLDTRLVGEGAFSSLRHAAKTLLASPYRCVPASATVYAQVVRSPHHAAMGALRPIGNEGDERGGGDDAARERFASCPGPPSHSDANLLLAFENGHVVAVTEPIAVYSVDFANLPEEGTVFEETFEAPLLPPNAEGGGGRKNASATADAVVFWWDCDLGPGESGSDMSSKRTNRGDEKASTNPITMSTSPRDNGARMHWRQGVKPLASQIVVPKEATALTIALTASDDDLRFKVSVKDGREDADADADADGCRCHAHALWGRDKVALHNDPRWRAAFRRGVEATLARPGAGLGTCLDAGDGPLLSVLAARAGAPGVLCVERDDARAGVSKALCAAEGGGVARAVKVVAASSKVRADANAGELGGLGETVRRAAEDLSRDGDDGHDGRDEETYELDVAYVKACKREAQHCSKHAREVGALYQRASDEFDDACAYLAGEDPGLFENATNVYGVVERRGRGRVGRHRDRANDDAFAGRGWTDDDDDDDDDDDEFDDEQWDAWRRIEMDPRLDDLRERKETLAALAATRAEVADQDEQRYRAAKRAFERKYASLKGGGAPFDAGQSRAGAVAAFGGSHAPAWVFLCAPGFTDTPETDGVGGLLATWSEHDLREIWRRRRAARRAGVLAPAAFSVPCAAAVRATPIECEPLWRRNRPIGELPDDVSGFDLAAFNELWPPLDDDDAVAVALSEETSHAPLADPATALLVELQGVGADDPSAISNRVSFTLGVGESRATTCHGIALWVDFDTCGGGWVSTGPCDPAFAAANYGQPGTPNPDDASTSMSTSRRPRAAARKTKRARKGGSGSGSGSRAAGVKSPQGTVFTTPTGSYGNRRDEIERARRAPYSTPSAFKQGVALLREPIVVGAGETVAVTVDVRFDPEARDGRGCVTAKVARVDRERTPRGG